MILRTYQKTVFIEMQKRSSFKVTIFNMGLVRSDLQRDKRLTNMVNRNVGKKAKASAKGTPSQNSGPSPSKTVATQGQLKKFQLRRPLPLWVATFIGPLVAWRSALWWRPRLEVT